MTRVAGMALAFVLSIAVGTPGHAQTLAVLAPAPLRAELKLQVQLDTAVIVVGDLWGNAGPRAATVIGPAPPPGRSIAIETAQLAYIARLYDVDWRPMSGVERTMVERTGRPVTREEMVEPIRRGLVEAGAAANVSVELVNFEPIMVPRESFPLMTVQSLAYDPGGERFSANLVATTEGMPAQRMQIAGRVVQMVAAIVAVRKLQPGDAIGPADVRATMIAERRLAGPVASDLAQVIGQSPRRTIVPGQPLAVADIGPQVMVAKGATVLMRLETPGMSIAAQGLALSAGGRDDMIEVMNPVSRAVVAARITGPGSAVILPGSTPITPPARTTPRNPEVSN